jgi:hypothetical protein
MDRTTIRRVLADKFSDSDLEVLCFDFGFDIETVGGSDKNSKTLHIVQWFERNGLIEDLGRYVIDARPELKQALSTDQVRSSIRFPFETSSVYASRRNPQSTNSRAEQNARLKVDLILPDGRRIPGEIDSTATLEIIRQDLVATLNLGNAEDYDLLLDPSKKSGVIGEYKPGDGDTVVLIRSRFMQGTSLASGVRTGIIRTYKNLEECRVDILDSFKNATDVRLFIQIGRREFGDQEPSLFWELTKEAQKTSKCIRVLRASATSPFLSAERARKRHTPPEQWQSWIRRLSESLELLRQNYGAMIEEREHDEPFLWRLFIFDDTAYVSGYVYASNNDQIAAVHKIVKTEDSLFAVFDRYFEYLWLKADPTISDPIQKYLDF